MLMYLGQRICYSYLYDLPYLFFTLIRSSTSISYTLVAFIMSAGFKSAANLGLTRLDLLQAGLVTIGVCLFQIDNMQSSSDSPAGSAFPLMVCQCGLLVEALGAYLLQSFKEEASPSSTEMHTVSVFWALVVCLLQCRPW